MAMRKLKLQVQMTIDGYIAGPNGEMDWATWNWDEDIKDYVKQITSPVDTIILGRKLAEGFIPHWTSQLESGAMTDEFTKKMVHAKKVVFTKTLETSEWARTQLAKGDLTEEIKNLKEQDGKDIIVYGGGSFVSNLIAEGLIDELHLFINPVAIGEGMTIFKGLASKQNMTLIQSEVFKCGIIVLCYQPNQVNHA
jgi:dihydrofolate reductase